jgi:hypothetical protein
LRTKDPPEERNLWARGNAFSPDRRMMPIPPTPAGVAMAAMVSSSWYIKSVHGSRFPEFKGSKGPP